MATAFSVYADTPERIINEGRSITIALKRTSPTTATVTWNTPITAADPTTVPPLAYYGIVILLDTQELRTHPGIVNGKAVLERPTPVDGKQYVGDPTADVNLFAGDKIGSAFVVGSFYNDTTTVSLNITGLDRATIYYVGGYAVDNVLRYHYEGVHTYSETYGTQAPPPACPGHQRIDLNIQPTDLTGLHSGTTYQIPLAIHKPRHKDTQYAAQDGVLREQDCNTGCDFLNFNACCGPIFDGLDDINIVNVVFNENDMTRPQERIRPNVIIVFDGSVALTWQALVDELNRQFALLCNPAVGVTPPNAGGYYFNLQTKELFLWNGFTLIPLSYIFDPNMPTAPNVGDYWVNTINGLLYQWNGTAWIPVPFISLGSDPVGQLTITIGEFWVSVPDNKLYQWNGTVWVLLTNFTASATAPVSPVLNDYWFNTTTNELGKWNGTVWAIQQPTIVLPPEPVGSGTLPPPAVGDYWYNTTDNLLYRWSGTTWLLLVGNVTSAAIAPASPAVGDFWFNTVDNLLYQWNGTSWVIQPATILPPEPTGASSTLLFPCDTIWFNGTQAYIWDGTVWIPILTFIQNTDPAAMPILTCGSYWFNTNNNTLYKWVDITGTCKNGVGLANGNWVPVSPILFPTDPHVLVIGDYWFDLKNNLVKVWNGAAWDIVSNAIISVTQPLNPALNQLWYNPSNEELAQWNGSAFIGQTVRVWDKDPANPPAGSVWWNTTTNTLFEWDILTSTWIPVTSFFDQPNDPSQLPQFSPHGAFWFNPVTGISYIWDGSQWIVTSVINYPTDPTIIIDGVVWHNTSTNLWYIRQGGVWIQIFPVFFATQPTAPTAGEYWINSTTLQLYQWNGTGWVLLSYSTTPPIPITGTQWYNTTTDELFRWNGTAWVLAIPIAKATLVPQANCEPLDPNAPFNPNPIQTVFDLYLTTGMLGHGTAIYVVPPSTAPTAQPFFIFDGDQLIVASKLMVPFSGSDPPPRYPQERQLGIGKTAETSERREMVQNVFLALGYSSVQVELTPANAEFCVTQALKELRRLSSSTYTRKFFFLKVFPNKQRYYLTDISKQFDTIHRVTAINRRTSTFLGQAEGQAVYGQLVLQHLYQMGTFDLVSYHIISDYIKMMEILFANRVMYLWDEKNHALDIFQTIRQPETMIIDCACERTENDIFADRFLNTWLLNWAVSEAELILAGVRGKFQSLPGAGGGVTLNAQDLRLSSEKRQTRCLQEINDWIANSNLEEWGMAAEFTFG